MAKKNNSNAMNIGIINAGRPVSPDEVYANKGLVMDVAKRLGWDHDSSKDLVQELAFKCWNDPRIRFDPRRGTLASYLARIANNTAVDMWRKNRHSLQPKKKGEQEAKRETEEPEKFDTELREKRMKLLEQGIEEMYRRYPSKEGNDAFVMFSRDGMSARQVAEKLFVEERFVNVAVHRGMERLARIVRRMEQDENWRNEC